MSVVAECRGSMAAIWRLVLAIDIPGEPVAKARPRVVTRGRGGAPLPFPRAITPAKSQRWEEAAAREMHAAAAATGLATIFRDVPVRVEIDAIWSRPGTLFRRADALGLVPRVSRPDADNVAKAVLDAGTRAALWADDAQVVDCTARKWTAEIRDRGSRTSGPPRVLVLVYVFDRTTAASTSTRQHQETAP